MNITEYNRYKTRPINFIEKFFKVANYNRGKYTNTSLHYWQKTVILNSDFLLIKKARNTGISTSMAMMMAYMLNYNSEKILYVCPKLDMAKNFISNVRKYFYSIPDNIRVKTITDNKHEFETEFSQLIVTTESDAYKAVRGLAFDAVLWDEMSDGNDVDKIYSILMQTICKQGYMLITNTPMSNISFFNTLWNVPKKFNTLEVKYSTNDDLMHPLNTLSKTQYNKIIRECAI